MKPYPLYVVGQKHDGSYETFTLLVPEGEGMDAAAEACANRRLVYIHCSRPKGPAARINTPLPPLPRSCRHED